jgi:hypothetical protein
MVVVVFIARKIARAWLPGNPMEIFYLFIRLQTCTQTPNIPPPNLSSNFSTRECNIDPSIYIFQPSNTQNKALPIV